MNDLLGFSGAAKEIVNAVSSGVGALYRPRAIRKEAEAQAYALAVSTQAEAQSNLIAAAGAGDELALRAIERFKATLIKRQNNLEDVIEQAIALANARKSKDGETGRIDSDWMTRFLNFAQDVSQRELKTIWASILAKEAQNEGTISAQTVDLLKNLTRSDAMALQAFLKIQQAFGGTFYPIERDCLQRNGLHESELFKLAELGLLKSPKTEWADFKTQLQQCYPVLTCILQSISPYTTQVASHIVSIYGGKTVSMYAYVLTSAGREIASALQLEKCDSVDAEDLFKSFMDVAALRQGYKFKFDDAVDVKERRAFEQSRKSYEDAVSRDRRAVEKWRKTHRQ